MDYRDLIMVDGMDDENKELKARIKALEGALSKIIETYPIDALGLTVDARMREIAREALSKPGEVQDG